MGLLTAIVQMSFKNSDISSIFSAYEHRRWASFFLTIQHSMVTYFVNLVSTVFYMHTGREIMHSWAVLVHGKGHHSWAACTW